MAAQDVRELIPRVRRAIEGPVSPAQADALSDSQVEALAADAIADVILLTVGQWPHTLEVSERDVDTQVPLHWSITDELSLPEESMIAAQAALTFFFHEFRDRKVSEHLENEGQVWEYTLSANMLRDQIKLLIDTRDAALSSLKADHPVLARYASILHVRDRVGAALLEPWTFGGLGLGGGQEQGSNAWMNVP